MRSDLFCRFENVKFRYAGANTEAIAELSFRIRSGLVTSILGASGSGKSAVLQLLLGLLEPYEGLIQVGRCSIKEASHLEIDALRSSIGVIFQGESLLENLTVEENLALPIAYKGRKLSEQVLKRIDKALENFDLPDAFVSLPVLSLNRSQRKIVCLAQALIKRPGAIFFDGIEDVAEPSLTRKFLKILRDYNKETGATIIYTTSQASLAFRYADRMMILDEGKLVDKVDSPDNLANSGSPLIKKMLGYLLDNDEHIPASTFDTNEIHFSKM
jgi:D-methionine transport system ATP-binding protein